jgi:hypothetical protein
LVCRVLLQAAYENTSPAASQQLSQVRGFRAERKAGELLAQVERAERGRPVKRSDVTTLSDLGITRDQSSQWQKLAAIPEAKFEAALVGIEVPSINGILRANRDPAALRPTPDRKGSDYFPTIDLGLIVALIRHVVPILPHRRIWEIAAFHISAFRLREKRRRRSTSTDRS